MTAGVIGFGNPQSRTAYERYVQGLEASFRWREVIDDPTFVLADDIDLYAKIRRDPVFAHALDMRKRGAAGREWTIEPESKSAPDRLMAKIVEAALRKIQGFTTGRFHLAEAIPRGSAYARVEGRRQVLSVEGGRVPSTVWWTPTTLRDVDRRRWRLHRDPHGGSDADVRGLERRAQQGDVDAHRRLEWARTRNLAPARWQFRSIQRSQWEDITPEEMAWFVRLDFGATEDTLGYGRGLLEALFFYAAAKTDLLRSGLEAAERFGQGIVTVAMDRLANEDVGPGDGARDRAQDYRDAIRKSRKDGVITFQKGDELDVLKGLGEGWQLIQSLIDYIDARVIMCALGANLPTLAEGGGSFALGAIQQDSQQVVASMDREAMSEAITSQVLPLFMDLNRQTITRLGLDGARPGKFSLVHEVTASDPAAFANMVKTLSEAGLPIRKRDVYQQANLTEPGPDDEILQPSAPAVSPSPVGQPASGGVAAPPGGGAPRPALRVVQGGP